MTTKRYDVGPEQGFRQPTTIKLTDRQAWRMGLLEHEPAPPREPDPPPGWAPLEGPCRGADQQIGVIPGRPTHVQCPACLQEVSVSPDGRLAQHERAPLETLRIPAEVDALGQVVRTVVPESPEAAQHWSHRLWKRA